MSISLNLEVLDPSAGPATGRVQFAPRLETLDGAVIGAIWNGRTHGDKIIRLVFELLGKRYRIKEFLLLRKPFLGNMAPREIYDEMVKKCNAVITGVGD